ncbi:MAG TPA: Os1348 family NHLP clan protein [Chloroflexia bacterium]|jgi:hypothetical protein
MAASNKARETLIGRVMLDEEFAKELAQNPTEAVKKAGIRLKVADLKKLEALAPEQRLAMLNHVRAGSQLLNAKAYLDNLKLI